jgi:hypothetical protein
LRIILVLEIAGDKRLAISAYILLNCLVLSLGCTSYALKDNYTNARKLFGVTFGSSPGLRSSFISPNQLQGLIS